MWNGGSNYSNGNSFDPGEPPRTMAWLFRRLCPAIP